MLPEIGFRPDCFSESERDVMSAICTPAGSFFRMPERAALALFADRREERRRRETLDRFFAEALPPEQRQTIRAVCVDMWEPFVQSLRTHVPDARIVYDKFYSRILAHLLRCDLLPTAYVRPREQRLSQQILRQRLFLVRVRTMVKTRIHVLIDGQVPAREMATQFSDLFGQAGLAWLRSVELPPGERQLLNSELPLLHAIRERITETDGSCATWPPATAHSSGPDDSRIGPILRRARRLRDR
jgi:Transposase